MENITYWMAYQILTGNVDTQNRNTYIYSPLNSDTWYFISWDNDGSFMRTEYQIRQFADQGSWESGISNYWGNVLFQRCLKSQTFRDKLNDAILDLKENYLTEDRLATMIESYKSVVKSYAYSMPDQMNTVAKSCVMKQLSVAGGGQDPLTYAEKLGISDMNMSKTVWCQNKTRDIKIIVDFNMNNQVPFFRMKPRHYRVCASTRVWSGV